jgi:hypothetical protein
MYDLKFEIDGQKFLESFGEIDGAANRRLVLLDASKGCKNTTIKVGKVEYRETPKVWI